MGKNSITDTLSRSKILQFHLQEVYTARLEQLFGSCRFSFSLHSFSMVLECKFLGAKVPDCRQKFHKYFCHLVPCIRIEKHIFPTETQCIHLEHVMR